MIVVENERSECAAYSRQGEIVNSPDVHGFQAGQGEGGTLHRKLPESADGKIGRRECLGCIGAAASAVFMRASPADEKGCARRPREELRQMSVGLSPSLTAALEHIAQERGFFAAQGLNAVLRTYSSGIAGMEDMLNGAVMAAASTAIPVALQAIARSDFRIIATLASLANDNILIARPDSGIHAVQDLAGKRIGCLKGGMPQFTLDLLLMKNGMSNEDIVLGFAVPEKLIEDLVQARLDAVVLFGRYLKQIRERLGENAVALGDRLLTELTVYVTMREEEIRKDPESVERLLRAYIQAEEFATAHRNEAESIVAEGLRMKISEVRKAWADGSFHVGLQQHLLCDLEDKAAWAIERGVARATAIPNYLKLFYCAGLERIDPSRVSIIHAADL